MEMQQELNRALFLLRDDKLLWEIYSKFLPPFEQPASSWSEMEVDQALCQGIQTSKGEVEQGIGADSL